jgi:hypothetical protein
MRRFLLACVLVGLFSGCCLQDAHDDAVRTGQPVNLLPTQKEINAGNGHDYGLVR